MIGKHIIIKNLKFKECQNDFMKDKDGKIILYDTLEEAMEVCGIYEFPNALVCKIEYNHIEK
jgi:hypothetical protein